MPPHSMPIERPITYQTFHEITNFICDNGDNCDEFCTITNTARAIKKAATKTKTSKKQMKRKIAKINGCLAPELLLQMSPNRLSSSPFNTTTFGKCINRPKLHS